MRQTLVLLLLASIGSAPAAAAPRAAPHPLDDPSREEYKTAVALVRADTRFEPGARFAQVALKEPLKAQVLAWKAGGPRPPRELIAAVYERKRNRFSAVTIDVGKKTIGLVEELRDAQPPVLAEEFELAGKIVRQDARWQEAMRRRGYTKLEELELDEWAPGLLSAAERASGRRLLRVLSYYKGKHTNFYAYPIEGVVATVDINTREVIDFRDTGLVPVNQGHEDLDDVSTAARRPAPRPLRVLAPSGPSFVRSGQQISWQGWSLRYSMHPQKGLQIYDVAFADEGQPRSILYKGSLAEMVVPYGDGDRNWSFRNAFDVGEYGLGRNAHSLEPRLDTPDNATLLDAAFVDDDGGPLMVPRAVGIYERDAGVLWKHVLQGKRLGDGRRGRQLVLTFTTTIGNYDYGMNWILHQDGTLETEVFLTGILLAKGSELEKNPCTDACRRLVAPRVLAPNHQHFFCFRLDLDVDGPDNTPYEMNVAPLAPGTDNPDRNAFDATLTALRHEAQAARDLSPQTARKWKVANPHRLNALGHPTGYGLMPGESAVPYLDPSSLIRKRAGFIEHPVWFTRYRDEEQSAAGEFPNQSTGGAGVPSFVSDNQSLENGDVVLWYTFGITHVPRPEEWPVMNAHRAGFRLMPTNFFSRNPALRIAGERGARPRID